MNWKKTFFLMSPLNINKLKNFSLYNKSKQYYNHSSQMFSFLFFFFQSMYCLFKKNVRSFFLCFFHMLRSTILKCLFFLFFFFFHFHCPVAFFSFCFFLFSFFFLFIHNKLLIQCLFFNLISTSLCPYLNTITIGSLPSLFNFSL